MERYSEIDFEEDSKIKEWLKKEPKWDQVQYATKDQLKYLHAIALKFGLYDAAEVVKRMI